MNTMRALLLLLLVLIALTLSTVGCSIGVKEQHTVTYVGIARREVESGVIRIATNDEVLVTVGDKAMMLDIGGYVAIRDEDLSLLIRLANEASIR